MPLIECVPNVSEGRRADVIAALANAVAGRGVHLLDRSSDPSHNRTVYTFVGDAGPLQAAVLRLFASAIAHIDLRHHDGVHPRIGAVDVVPFVPLNGAALEDCVELARSTAELVSRRFMIPVYLYEDAALHAGRKRLADIRQGGFEGLASRIQLGEWQPDVGGRVPHPTAGVSVIGTRPALIAYNVNLDTDRVAAAT